MGLGLASLAVAAVGTAVSYSQNKKSMAAQEEAQEIESNRQQAQAMRQRRQQARQARIRRAQVRQAARNTGTQGSTGEMGAISAITARTGEAGSFLSGQKVAASAISNQNQRAADSAFRSQLSGQIASLGYNFAGSPGQQKAVKDLFS